MTSCLNTHTHNKCIQLPQNRLSCKKDGIFHYLHVKIAKHSKNAASATEVFRRNYQILPATRSGSATEA